MGSNMKRDYKMKLKFCALLMIMLTVSPGASAVDLNDLKTSLAEYRTAQSKSATDPLPSGIFYDLVAPLSGIERFDGSAESPVIDFKTWVQISHELRRADLSQSNLPSHKVFRERQKLAQTSQTFPISLLLFDYQAVREGVDKDQIIDYQDGKVVGLNVNSLETRHVAGVSILHEWTYHGSSVAYSLDPARDVFTNLGELARVEADFGDGNGFHDVTQGGEFHVAYSETGFKTISVRVETRTGRTLFSRTRVDVRHLDAPPASETWALTAAQSTGGPLATGEAYILYGAGHTMVERPVVLVEGLDLTNSLNWDELYDLMNQELLIESLLAIGYDAVVLNYTNSTIPVQDNGYLVQELIEELNSATGAIHPLVMVGTSLGGVTTRFALSYMEANSLPHNVSTFISVDSPQNGANIPVGIQHWADFFASQAVEAAEARDALLAPAPRQLLLYHLTASGGGTANPDPMFAALQNHLASLGDYPSQPRIVSVINGSGTQQNSGFLPGAQIIRWVYDSFVIDIRGNVWAVSNSVNTRVLQGLIDLIWPLPDESRNVFIQPCLPWDNAPGGLTATMEELAGVPAPYGDIQALHPSHCFIPSVSALDLNVADPFFDIAGAGNLYDLTPFDSVYFPAANQEHVAITPENAAWFINEIVGPLETPELTVAVEGDSLQLRWEPIFGANSYRVYFATETENWPPIYSSTTTTEWTVAAADELGFFRVTAERN